MQIDITVHSDPGVVRDEWLALQSTGLTTLYQTYEWCTAWLDTIGRADGVNPQIVVGRGAGGKAVFILPLVIQQHGNYRIVEWLGSNVATYGYGIYDSAFLADGGSGMAPYWPSVLSSLPATDAIWLNHLPAAWRGHPHPLATLFSTRSANQTHQISLKPCYDELYASKRSSSSRRGASRRDRQLCAAGEVKFGRPEDKTRRDQLIDEMIIQQTCQLAARGVHNVFDDGITNFLKKMSELTPDSQVSIFPQYLEVNGRLVAAKLGFVFDGTYWAMISSLDAAELHKFSPGDYALRRTIAACCERELEVFDFATGDSDYKHHWSDSSIALHEIIQARSARGVLWTTAKRASIDAKRIVKNSTYLWPKLAKLRKATLGSVDS